MQFTLKVVSRLLPVLMLLLFVSFQICVPFSLAIAAPGPLSAYCDSVLSQLLPVWQKRYSTAPYDVEFDCLVNADGNVVSFSGRKAHPQAAYTAAYQVLSALKMRPPPNGKPIWITAGFSSSDSPPVGVSARDTDFRTYMSALEAHIKQSLLKDGRRNQDWVGKRTIVKFVLFRDGNISKSSVLKISGSTETDALALNAIIHAAPMPDGSPQFVDVEFSVDFNQ
jgi:hypothetical protein